MKRAWLALMVAAAVVHVAPDAAAAPTAAEKETARKLVKEGRKKLKGGEVDSAIEDFESAHEIMGVPTTGLQLGKAQIEAHLLVEARDTLLAVTRIPEEGREPWQYKKARKDAKKLAKDIEPRIPQLELELIGRPEGSELSLTIDGDDISMAAIDVPLSLNPGDHVVVVRSGKNERRVEVNLSEGEKSSVTLDVSGLIEKEEPKKDEPKEEPSGGPSALVYVGYGVAGAGLLVGGVTGFMTLSKGSDLDDQCVDNRCPPSAHDDVDAGQTLGTISTVSFIVAGAGAALGTWALLSTDEPEKDEPPKASASLWIGAGSAGVRGRF